MDLKEAYKVMQAAWVKEHNAEEGDEVEVVRPNSYEEFGASCYAHTQREIDRRGAKFTIKTIGESSINITVAGGDYTWVTTCLSLRFVSKAEKPEKMIAVKGKEYSEDTLQKMIQQYVKED